MRCAVPKCQQEEDVEYIGKPVCDYHWMLWATDSIDKLRKKVGLPPIEKASEREIQVDSGEGKLYRDLRSKLT